MSSQPKITINVIANTASLAALNREVTTLGERAQRVSAGFAGADRTLSGTRRSVDAAVASSDRLNKSWDRAKAEALRVVRAIQRGSGESRKMAEDVTRVDQALQRAAKSGSKLVDGLSIGIGVNLVDRVVQGVAQAPQALARVIERGLDYNRQMQSGQTQFAQLLGDTDAARRRMQELSDFGAKTPFELPGVVRASITLQTLTRGVMATGDGLTMVGDAAALAKVPIEEMAVHIGRLYDGLQSGRPVGIQTQRLQELGLISGNVRNQIEAMQQAGAAGADVWALAADALAKYRGQMAQLAGTQEGLLSNLNDVVDATLGKVTEPLFEAINKALPELLHALETMDLTPLQALGETFARATELGLDMVQWAARNSDVLAMVMRLGGAVMIGGTVVATVRATRALAANYAAWVRASYQQAAYGKQTTATNANLSTQTAVLNTNTIAVNNNALARQRAAMAPLAGSTLTAGQRTAWEMQNAGRVARTPRAPGRVTDGLRRIGSTIGGGMLAGSGLVVAGSAVGLEWWTAQREAMYKEQDRKGNDLAAAAAEKNKERLYPTSSAERDKFLAEVTAEIADLERQLADIKARRQKGGMHDAFYERDLRAALRLKKSEVTRQAQQDEAAFTANIAPAEARRAADATTARRTESNTWLQANSTDIDKEYQKTRVAVLDDAQRLAEVKQFMADGARQLSAQSEVWWDVGDTSSKELVTRVIPEMQRRLDELAPGSAEHTDMRAAIARVSEWATRRKGAEAEAEQIGDRMTAVELAGRELELEAQVARARRDRNTPLLEELEHKRELIRAEEQVNRLVSSGVAERERAAELVKGMVEDARQLREQERAEARARARRDEAGELAVLEYRAAGRDDLADALARELDLRSKIKKTAEDLGVTEAQAEAHLRRRQAAESKIDQRKKDEKDTGKNQPARRERGYQTDASGNRLYRTESGEWKRAEDMTHSERVASGTATYVRDGAAAVGMRPGFMDTREDSLLRRNAFAPPPVASAMAASALQSSIPPAVQSVPAAGAPPLPAPAQAAPAAANLGQSARAITAAAGDATAQISQLIGTVEAGFTTLGTAAASGDQRLKQQITTLAARLKDSHN